MNTVNNGNPVNELVPIGPCSPCSLPYFLPHSFTLTQFTMFTGWGECEEEREEGTGAWMKRSKVGGFAHLFAPYSSPPTYVLFVHFILIIKKGTQPWERGRIKGCVPVPTFQPWVRFTHSTCVPFLPNPRFSKCSRLIWGWVLMSWVTNRLRDQSNRSI